MCYNFYMRNHKHTSERGSIEVIIAVVLLLIVIGALAWVFLVQLPASNKIAEEATVVKPTEQATATGEYLVVKEWGIKIPEDTATTKLNYSIDQNNMLVLRSKVLDGMSGECKSNSVYVMRGKEKDHVMGEDESTGVEFKRAYDSVSVSPLTGRSIKAKVGEYYYVPPSFSGASCLTDPHQLDKETTAVLDIIRAFNKVSVAEQ